MATTRMERAVAAADVGARARWTASDGKLDAPMAAHVLTAFA